MKNFLLGFLAVLLLATPAYSETATPASPPSDLRADLSPRIDCGDVMGTAFAVTPNILVTAYHVTSHASVACELPATHERAYIMAEDTNADISFLYVFQDRPWYYRVDCNGYVDGETYYGAGWPREGFRITKPVTFTGQLAKMPGFFWGEAVLSPGAFEHGQSGGPVVNQQGFVVGMVNAGTDDGKYALSRQFSDTAICRTAHDQ